MIDFRYHLISIVAVLLALSVGIVMGTGVLGGPALEILNDKVGDVSRRNEELRAEINDLNERIDTQERFAEAAEPYMVDGRLEKAPVVVIEMEGTGGGLIDEAREEVEDAGAVVAATLEVGKKLELADQIDREELALAIGSSASDPADLRADAAEALAVSAAAAAAGGEGTTQAGELQDLVRELEDAGFASFSGPGAGPRVPPGAAFLLLGGGEGRLGYDPAPFVLALASGLAEEGAAVLVAETSDSNWDLVQQVVADPVARERVSTVGGGDRVEGRIAIVLGLSRAIAGEAGHYGSGEGAEAVLPPHPSD